jgi:hypothetical protein
MKYSILTQMWNKNITQEKAKHEDATWIRENIMQECNHEIC